MQRFITTIPTNTTTTVVIREQGLYEVNLVGEGARAIIAGSFALRNKDKQHYQVIIHHQAPHTTANTKLLGTVRDTGFLQLKGKIIIDANCHDCESFLTERVLLLTATARAEVVPDLEILNNEVHCSHAASISRIPESQLFYIQSRGVTRKKAETMIARGFLLQ